MRNFNCDKCGEVAHVLINGYDFGDRLLEGVKFEIRQKRDGLKAKVSPDAEPYFEGLNKRKWLKAAAAHADVANIVECPVCHGEIVFNDEWSAPCATAIPVVPAVALNMSQVLSPPQYVNPLLEILDAMERNDKAGKQRQQ